MKTFPFKPALGILLLSALITSCETKTTTFSFTYVCSKDLLQFVTPTASWQNVQGKDIQLVLTDDRFSDKPENLSISIGDVALSYWTGKIIADGEGISRDMTISYALKENAPDVNAKEYAIYHKISGNYSVETSSWGSSSVEQHTNVTIGKDDYTTTYLKGEELTNALNELVNHPDYLLIETAKKE